MRVVTTKHRIVTTLSKEMANEDALFLIGPDGAQVVVMSQETFLQRTHPEVGTSPSSVTREETSSEARGVQEIARAIFEQT